MQRFCIQKTYISDSIYDSINICIHFVQFVHCLYVQKTYKGCFSQLVVSVLYSLYIICSYVQKTYKSRFSQLVVQVFYSLYNGSMYKKHTFQVSSRFWSKLCASFVYFVHFLYICRNVMYSFFVHSLSYKILICTIFLYKIHTNIVFYIIFVYIMYNFCTNFLVFVMIE